jgi:hypothetical protein
VKAKQGIFDGVKDHLIPHLSEKKTTKKMFDALVNLYQRENINRKMILWYKVRSIEMTRSKTVTSYLVKVACIRDQLTAVGKKIADAELMNMALNGFPASWEPFVKSICARENLPKFERLWDDCIQKETRMESKVGKKGGADNLDLIGQNKEV